MIYRFKNSETNLSKFQTKFKSMNPSQTFNINNTSSMFKKLATFAEVKMDNDKDVSLFIRFWIPHLLTKDKILFDDLCNKPLIVKKNSYEIIMVVFRDHTH